MNNSFGNKIEERLRAMNMTQRELASQLNVSEVTVSRWINGERNPTVGMISKIAKILGTTESYFFAQDAYQNEQGRPEEKSGMSTGLKVTFGVILGLVITAVAAGLLSKDEKDKIVDVLKNGEDSLQGGK